MTLVYDDEKIMHTNEESTLSKQSKTDLSYQILCGIQRNRNIIEIYTIMVKMVSYKM